MFLKSFFGGLALKIVVPIFLVVGAVLVALGFMTTQATFSRLTKQAQETRDFKVQSFADVYRLSQENPAALGEFVNRLKNEKILAQGFIAVADQNNKIIYKSDNTPNELATRFASNSGETKFDEWNVARQTIAGAKGDITVIGAYSENDPQISGELARIRTTILLTAALLFLLLTALIFYVFYRVTSRLKQVVEVADRIAEGDLRVEVKVDNNDEIGRLQASMRKMIAYLNDTASVAKQISTGNLTVNVKPRSVNDQFGMALESMLHSLLKFVQSKDERDQLQEAIMKLLNEVADVANGDLTAEAEVTPSMTGAIADAFNYMIAELRSVIYRVMQASLQVSSSANQIRSTTERLAEGSELQSEQITATSAAIEDMAASIQDVSQNAALSARVAGESLVNAKKRHASRAKQHYRNEPHSPASAGNRQTNQATRRTLTRNRRYCQTH